MLLNEKNRIYNFTVSALESGELTKEEIFTAVAKRAGLGASELASTSPFSAFSRIRAAVSEILSALCARGLVKLSGTRYSLTETKPVVVRAARCEKEIIAMLSKRPMSKKEIREELEVRIGTKRTATKKDDNTLFSYLGQILKRLTNEKTIVYAAGVYKISKSKSASVGDIEAMLALKNDFLERLHSRGGEFFEHYFLTLLSKYLSKHGKTVLESYVTGGSADGGIDGVAKTRDTLGFRETIMIQTKNRNIYTSETDVRSFYGAVCAASGSRGIYVTSSDFHSSAADFLDSIDNCVGVNGEKIFDMATECQYGIKRRDGKYIIDTSVI